MHLNPDSLPAAIPPAPLPNVPQGFGPVFLIRCNPERPADLPRPAMAALAFADVVFYDEEIDPRTLALIPGSCFVEQVQPGAAGNAARLEKLAGEGWRVVRLALDKPTFWSRSLAEADQLAALGIAICTIAGHLERRPAMPDPAAVWPGPRPLSVGMNGLAG
jgi:hypothetical protein